MKTAIQNLLIAGLLAVATLTTGTLAVVELARSAPEQAPLLFTFDVGEDAVAAALVDRAKSPADLEKAVPHLRKALTLSPYNNNARLRLAFIDSKQHQGKLSQTGARYLAQSYDLVPYDPSIAAWRIRFALEHWQSLSVETRKAAQAEAYALGSGTAVSNQIRASLRSVQNPVGRVSAQLWLLVLKLR